MKIIGRNPKQHEYSLLCETSEDVWYLSQLIEPNDTIKGKTTRKIKVSEEADATKRTITVVLTVQKTEYTAQALRVLGTILEGPDDVPKGSHQGITIEPGDALSLVKPQWLDYHKRILTEATESAQRILVCVFDREDAFFALVKPYGAEVILHLRGDVQRKRHETKIQTPFFSQVVSQLADYDERYKLSAIILASPSFWKEELLKYLKNDALRKKLIQTTCSSADESAINEVLRKDDVQHALHKERASKELALVEQILFAIAKDQPVAYGLPNVTLAANAGAIKTLLITDKLIQHHREHNTFDSIHAILRLADQHHADIHIISCAHDGGKKLDGLSGIAALLRYKIT